jgi:23S rRNA (pseudouridine1915-N3)-methyltransferase
MANVNIIAVGKLKEGYFKDAVAEYKKRLSGNYCNLNIVEVPDKSIRHNDGIKQQEIVLNEEGDSILKRIKETDYVIALCVEGKQIDSIELADKIESLAIMGKSNICFIIGGSLGLSSKVKVRADFKLSFSKLTFPHQLMRIILLEQVYRAFKIQKNEVYHK